MSKLYVITEYYNNGESYEDNYNTEQPIRVFENVSEARQYCKSKNCTEIKSSIDRSEIASFRLIKDNKYKECPENKIWQNCDEDYNEDYCDECQSYNFDIAYDYSFVELKIYEVRGSE